VQKPLALGATSQVLLKAKTALRRKSFGKKISHRADYRLTLQACSGAPGGIHRPFSFHHFHRRLDVLSGAKVAQLQPLNEKKLPAYD